MKRVAILISFLVLLSLTVSAQVVTTDPEIPSVTQSVSVYFDATEGAAGLAGYDGDVYAHTGVLTSESTGTGDWKYVKTNWGENTPDVKLEKVSADYYKLEIGPSINEYYGVPEAVKITHLAFVFRSGEQKAGGGYYEGKDTDNKDIFIEVVDEGLAVEIVSPAQSELILEIGNKFNFEAVPTAADSIALFINGKWLLSKEAKDTLRAEIQAIEIGDYVIKVKVYDPSKSASDSIHFYVVSEQIVSSLPEGLTDGINYTSDTSVTLVLYAPNKKNVIVIGDFTSWNANKKGHMKRTPDGNRNWLEINGLEPGKEYRYQYLCDHDCRIPDPYTDKVLDPWNDPWIDEATYPGLIDYPWDSSNNLVSVLQPGQEEYTWKNTKFIPPEKKKLVIYELLVRDFIAAHDFKTLTDTLGYLDSLGVNAIELMPINEFDGNSSWGYMPALFFAPDKYYGPKNTLKALIDSCHGRDIAVIMDIVLNHTGGSSPLVRLYMDPSNNYKVFPENPWYNVENPNPYISYGYDIDHESQATKDLVDRVNRYWLNEYRFDGFRFDFTKGFTNTPGDGGAYDASRIAILKRIADSIWADKPEAYVILEHWTDNSEEKELADYGMMIWCNITEEFAEGLMGYESDFYWGTHKARGYDSLHLITYMESHDEERIQYKVKTYGNEFGDYDVKTYENRLARQELGFVFLLSIPGPKMLWQFGEIGYSIARGEGDAKLSPKPIFWDSYNEHNRKRVYQVCSAMNHLKTNYEVFSTTDYDFAMNSALKRINLNHPDMNVTVLGNFGLKLASIDPNFQSAGTWYEYFTGDVIEVSDPNDRINLQAGEYRLYTSVQLTTGPVVSQKPSTELIPGRSNVKIYPNPSAESFNISFELQEPEEVVISIYDMSGRKINQIANQKMMPGWHEIEWDGRTSSGNRSEDGVYMIKIRTGDFYQTRLIIYSQAAR